MEMQLEDSLKRHELGTDEEVIVRVLDGAQELFEVLIRRNNQRLYRTARAILKDESEVEDVMQQAYLNAFTHLREFRHEARFSTWLTRIAVHESFARLRGRKRFDPSGTELQTEEAIEMSTPQRDRNPEERAGERELGVALEKAIDALPETFRTVFMLRAIEEMSVTETAHSLDIPEDTVKTRLHRARGLLQKALGNSVGSGSARTFAFHLTRCDRVVAAVMNRIRGNPLAARTSIDGERKFERSVT